jgi:hypothetical protein
MPPAEFTTGSGNGKITITIVPVEDGDGIRRACPNVSFVTLPPLACAHVYPDGRCTIFIVPGDQLRAERLNPEWALVHEFAHCAGWHGDHRGARLPQ